MQTPQQPHAANLEIIREGEGSPEVEALYARFRAEFGRPHVPPILQCFATHPPLLEHMMGLAKTMLFADGALGRANKEMIATFVSSANRCAYCADSHGFFLTAHGGSAQVLDAVMRQDLESPSLTSAQQVLLRFARKITENSSAVVEEDVAMMRDAGWSDLQIAEAIHLTALFASFNRVVNAFGLSSQEMLAMIAAGREGNG